MPSAASVIPAAIWPGYGRPRLTSGSPARTLRWGPRDHGAVRLRLHADPRRPDRCPTRRRTSRRRWRPGSGTSASRTSGCRSRRWPRSTRLIRDGRRDELPRGRVARPRQRARLGRGGARARGRPPARRHPRRRRGCRGSPASGIRYLPFAGRVSGHPSELEGASREIVESARAARRPTTGVHGLDLLAWRSRTDAVAADRARSAPATGKPVIVAGSIDRSRSRRRGARRRSAPASPSAPPRCAGRFPAARPGSSRRQLAAFRPSRLRNHLNSDGCARCARAVRARLPFSRPVH